MQSRIIINKHVKHNEQNMSRNQFAFPLLEIMEVLTSASCGFIVSLQIFNRETAFLSARQKHCHL